MNLEELGDWALAIAALGFAMIALLAAFLAALSVILEVPR